MNTLYPNTPQKLAYARQVMQRKARDNARTPVQWSAAPNAGFCAKGTTPWMRVNDDYETVNSEAQQATRSDGDLSPLQFWKRGLKNRKEHKDVFVYGSFERLTPQGDKGSVFAYRRASRSEAFVVLLNFSGDEVAFALPEKAGVQKWVAGSWRGELTQDVSGTVRLRPWEGLLGVAKA